MSKTAKGFWSYVHSDDKAAYGAIGRLAEHLSTEFSALTGGRKLDFFRDTAQLKWGEVEHLRSGNVEEMGLLELLVAGEEALPHAVETLSAISEEIQVVGKRAQAASQGIQQSDAKGGGFKGRLLIANQLAKDLEDPASRLEQLGNEYVADLVIVDPAIRKMIELATAEAENPDDLNEFFDGTAGMATASEEGVKEIATLIAAMEESAQFSRELEAPLKQMRVSLQGLVDGHQVFEKWQELIAEARG